MAHRVGFQMRHLGLDFRKKKIDRDLKTFSDISNTTLKSIYITGPVQVGKTSFLCTMLKHQFSTWAGKVKLPAYRLPVFFAKDIILVTHEDLKTIIFADMWDRDNSDISVTVEDLCDCRHLLIDDLSSGNEKPNSVVVAKLWQIIDHRWRRGTRTWVTGNISKQDLKTKFPDYERICGRLFHQDWMLYAEVT